MSEKAKILGSSTLSQSMQETAVESAPTETPTIETTQVDNSLSNTSATAEGNLETIKVPESTPEPQEENIGKFDFNFGEENKSQENQPPTPSNDWRSALKNVDRNELLKELGIDDFSVKLNEHLKKGGKASDFIAAKGINWDEVADLDLVRAEFDAKYPTLTKEQKAHKFNKEYVAAEFDDEEIAMDKSINLKTAAYEARLRRKADQQNFKEPEVIQPDQDPEYTNWKSQQQLNTDKQQQFKTLLANHEATKNLLQNKRVAIQVDDKGTNYNFDIDKPEAVINALTDGGNTWRKMIQNEQGEPDIQKQQLIMLFASNPQKFVGQIFNYGKMQGVKQKVQENQNAHKPDGTMPRSVTTTEKEMWKNPRQGTIGGN